MCRLLQPRRTPRNVAHESTVTRPQSVASANAISNFPEADLWLFQLSVWPLYARSFRQQFLLVVSGRTETESILALTGIRVRAYS